MQLINRHAIIFTLALAPVLLLSGCGCLKNNHRPTDHILTAHTRIAYMDGKYRVCRDNCPSRTEKVLDDTDYSAINSATNLPPNISGPGQAAKQPVAQPLESPIRTEANEVPIKTFVVQFEFGTTKPTREGRRQLDLLTEAAKQAPTAIELLGETDTIGTKNYNNKLAFKRAHFVARWLKEHGVSAKISVEAKGGCCHPLPYDKTEKALLKMRRVKAEVQVFVQPKKEIKK